MFAEGIAPFTRSPVVAGYMRRSFDYRSILGEIIRKHLGAQFDTAHPAAASQLSRIIPGYAVAGEALYTGGSSTDNAVIGGEVGFL